jgi:tetratricopeptide (TPR) repeat protein
LLNTSLFAGSRLSAFTISYACALAKQKDHHGAIKSLEWAIALKPDYAKAFHNLGASRQALGELAAAEDHLGNMA